MNPATTQTAPLYQMIVRDIEEKIRKGQLRVGETILSIGQMCDYYQVSAITAKGAISMLRNRGLIHSIKGKGCFVAETPRLVAQETQTLPLQRIALLTATPGFFQPRGFYASIWQSIEEAVMGQGLEFRLQHIPVRGDHSPVDFSIHAKPEEGLIIMMPFLSPQLLALARDRSLRTVWIDAAYAYAHCVLTDNLGGVRELLDHLQQLGHKRFLMASEDPRSPNPTNENERSAAFQYLVRERDLASEILPSATPREIVQRLRRGNAPTAILFTQDDPAIRFIAEARKAGIRIPTHVSVTGFDDWAQQDKDPNGLTTLHVDRRELGRKAVEVLCRPNYFERTVAEWVRVPGSLVVRATTGRAAARR